MVEEIRLPKDWRQIPIRDVAAINPKLPNKEIISNKLEVQFLPMKLVEEVVNKIHLTETRKLDEVLKGSYTPFIDGDIIFAKVTPCMENGKIALVNNLKNGVGFGSSEFHVIRAGSQIIGKYIFNYLVQDRFRNEAANEMTGAVGLRRVPKQFIENYPIPLPPIKTQQLIVSKIEELFSELDKGIENLKTAQQKLKTYRQAVLKWAFEGKLTEEWRKKNKENNVDQVINEIRQKGKAAGAKIKYSKVSIDADGKLLPIPVEWRWIRNEELIYYVTSGSRDWKKYYSTKGSYFIRTQNLNTDSLYLSDAAFVDLPKKVEGKRSLVQKGDLLMTITGANVGRVAYVDQEIPEAYVSQSVALMKYIDKRMIKYLWYYFQCRDFGQGLISGLVYGIGRPVLNLENMKEVPVAFCSIEEQKAVIKEIENRLSVADKLDERINQSLEQTEALRQSILKKAFEGRLI